MTELKTEDGKENGKKRVRDELDDTEANSPDSKIARIDAVELDGNSDDPGTRSPEAKRIQDDLLKFLDDADPDPGIQDLDSVIRSFEEEILVPVQDQPVVTSDSGESRPELGFLLEASDDELGLPPSFYTGEEQKIEAVDLKTSGSEAVDLDDIALGFENGMPNYDEPYNFGINGDYDGKVNVSDDFIALGSSLFEGYEPGDFSEFAWRTESL